MGKGDFYCVTSSSQAQIGLVLPNSVTKAGTWNHSENLCVKLPSFSAEFGRMRFISTCQRVRSGYEVMEDEGNLTLELARYPPQVDSSCHSACPLLIPLHREQHGTAFIQHSVSRQKFRKKGPSSSWEKFCAVHVMNQEKGSEEDAGITDCARASKTRVRVNFRNQWNQKVEKGVEVVERS